MERLQIRLIVGLGNVGLEYAATRHNLGFMVLDEIARKYSVTFKPEHKFFAEFARVQFAQYETLLLKPTTYMNVSGKAVLAISNFFKIKANEILVIHDDLDFAPGIVRLKRAGGSAGHNGLRDIDNSIGKDYWRLRLGIGHPGEKHQVSSYVLHRPAPSEQSIINASIDQILEVLPNILSGDMASAQQLLHKIT